MYNNLVIGITGTIASGKGSVAQRLVEEYSFKHRSVRAFLDAEVEKRNLPKERESYQMVGNYLRVQYGPTSILDAITHEEALTPKVVIESIRSVPAAEKLHEQGGYLISIDAPIETRYQRLLLRNDGVDRGSLEEFAASEAKEMNSTDRNKQNLGACMLLSQYHIDNDEGMEKLYAQVDAIIKDIFSLFKGTEQHKKKV